MPSVFPERVKGLKITRKLTISIVCLVLSLAFCVWAVLAWFAANSEADAAGMNISVSSDDLGIGLLVYPLEQTGENSYVIKKGADGNPVQGSTSLNMPAYTSGECTAVLIAITVSNSAADMQYSDVPISLSCSGGAQLGAYSAAENKFSCAISNAVTVWSADTTAGGETEERGDDVYSKKSNSETEPGNEQSFVDAAAQPVEKQSVLQLSPLMEIDAYPDKVTANYIMDYSPELMSWLYGLALGALGAGSDSPELTASIDFADDLTFNIGSGTGTEVHVHEWETEWSHDETHHWRACTSEDCEERSEVAEHSGEWTVTRQPTATEEGLRERDCEVCGRHQSETIPVISEDPVEHSFAFSYEELQNQITAEGGTLADAVALTSAHFANNATNSFISLTGSGSADYRQGNAGECIQMRGDALSVTFLGTGTLTVTVRSTGTGAQGCFALKDASGNYIAAASRNNEDGDVTIEGANGTYYMVTGGFTTYTFNITQSGTYTVSQFEDGTYSGALRVSALTMTDIY